MDASADMLPTLITIADMEVEPNILVNNISEAIQYSNLDRGIQFKLFFLTIYDNRWNVEIERTSRSLTMIN